MNCDDVFEALTDPALDHSAAVEAHLANCPRCRQLRQVLEPARSLLCGDLPAERTAAVEPADEPADERPRAARPMPVVSVESVGLAEAIAAQLALSKGAKSVPPRRPFAKRRAVVAALRGAALVLFGALAVYCIGPHERDSDSHSLPAVVPSLAPAGTCTRTALQRKDQAPQDARHVILSCVGCHMNERQPLRPPATTSLFWPARRPADLISLARVETKAWTPV